ncbi:MAG: radical SAM protein [Planctomycetota bacterium]|nr:radical SAM protein [Planctomycetota bacterium]
MDRRQRPYLFYDTATSICGTCLRRADAKIVFQDECVWMLKRCPEHGKERVLIADDIEYWRKSREVWIKPSEMPAHFGTPVKYGCPYDCGLCADHEQHSCLTLVEITDRCNLSCPICYAESGPNAGSHRSLAQVESMLDAVVHAEGEPDVVQISGGEPTLHPQFFEILDAARARPIKHLMLNTNGVKIANDAGFAERLASYAPGFEIYLQFDSLDAGPQVDLRGADLTDVRTRALEKLNALNLSTTLVVTVKKGLNDDQLGAIVEYALQQPCVRGVTFQPIQEAGRVEDFDEGRHRITLTEVRRGILEQTETFRPEDIIPVPCHPDSLAMAYAIKTEHGALPLTGLIDPQVLIDGPGNTIVYEHDEAVKGAMLDLFATNHSPASGASALKELLCCLPTAQVPEGVGYDSVFRIIIMQFIDAAIFDVRSVKKTCVHIVHPDGRMIPFDTYNLFYRGDLEERVLAPLRAEIPTFETARRDD